MSDPSFADALSDSEVRIWINACNHEPARQALRQLLAYRIRGVSVPLADPIPEAPADEEVEGLAQALRNLAEGAEQEDRTILYKAADALRRSTKTDKPGVREAALEAGVARFAREQVLAANQHERAYAVECVEREILSLLSDAPKATHRHKKRGTEYVLIGYGKMQAERWGTNARLDTSDGGYGFVVTDPVDMREVAIYRSATDPTEMWVRPRDEFEDGRFEPLPRSTTGGAK